jgi:hypothetical protein
VKVFRRIRAQLAAFQVPFKQYDAVTCKWMYWNDFTLTGLKAWRDQAREQPDVGTSDGEDTVEADMAADEDASTTTMDGHHDLSDESEHRQQSVEHPIEEFKSTPVDRATSSLTSPIKDMASRHSNSNATTTSPPTVEMPAVQSPPAVEMPEVQQSPPLLQAPDAPQTPEIAPTTTQWFQSPPPRVNPTTGHTHLTPIPVHMQRMIAKLTDQAEWYEGDTTTTPSDPASTLQPRNTIDLTMPPSGNGQHTRVPATLDIRFQGADFISPGLNAAGFPPDTSTRRP